MPIDIQKILDKASRSGAVNGPRNDYPEPPKSIEQAINSMPNSDRVSPVERGIFSFLSGVSESSFGKNLAAFNETSAGKTLNYVFDVLAEGAERTLGVAVQHLNDPLDKDELKAAWYAGSMLYDTTNLPMFTRSGQGKEDPEWAKSLMKLYHWDEKTALEYTKSGRVTGISIPNDLPGPEAMSEYRQKIAGWMAQGMDPEEALLKAKDEYMNGLGALGLRAQLYDTYGHVLLDPLNKVMAFLKPVSRIKALGIRAANTKSIYTLNQVADLEKMARAAGNVEEADEFVRLAQKLQVGEMQSVNAVDRVALFLTGAGELQPGKLRKIVEKTPLLNMFSLTPESKAQELITVIDDGLNTNVVANVYNNADAPGDFYRAMTYLDQSTTGEKYGHMMATLEGRTMGGFLKGAHAAIEPIYNAYNKTSDARNFLSVLAKTVGDTPSRVLKMAQTNAADLLKTLSRKPELADLLKSGQITQESLETMGQIMKNAPINKDMFFAMAMNAIADHSMRQAVTQFGVKARGPFMKWMGALKSAESLAFLGLGNYSYVIRNVVVDNFTQIGRGVFGAMSLDEVNDFWKAEGFIPARLADDMTVADAERFATGADAVLRDALRGKTGLADRVTELFQKSPNKFLDTKKMARAVEKNSRMRSMTVGYNQYWDDYKPTPISKTLDSAEFDNLNRQFDGLTQTLEQAARSARGNKQTFRQALGENLNLNTQAVFDEATNIRGQKVEDMMDADTVTYLHKNLPDAIKNNTTGELITQVRAKIDNHIEEQFTSELKGVVEDISNRVQLEGPTAYTKSYEDAVDTFWWAHTEHAMRTQDASRLAREASAAGEHALARSMWEQQFADDAKYFDRAFRRLDSIMEGLDEGAKALRKQGFDIPLLEESRELFKGLKKGWKDFFTFRNKTTRAHFEATDLGKKSDWTALQAQKDAKYREMIELERSIMQHMDDSVATQISDPQLKTAYIKARKLAADLRANDKGFVVDLYEKLKDLSGEARNREFQNFWRERTLRYSEMRDVDQAAGKIMQGDPEAQKFVLQIDEGKRAADVADIKESEAFKAIREKAAKIREEKAAARASETPLTDEYLLDKGASRPFIGNAEPFMPKSQPINISEDLMAYGRTYGALDTVVEAARNQAQKTPLLLDQLPDALKTKVTRWADQIENEFGGHRFAATRYAEFRSDSALLNYNRRTNFDTWTATVFPFAFWTTGSMAKWALHSIDRPAMLSSYLKIKKFMETAGLHQEGMPSRIKGNIRVRLPFAPDWLGDQFIDPLSMALPFEAFASPFEGMRQAQTSNDRMAERILQDMATNREITDREFEEAVTNRSGSLWEMAISKASSNSENGKFDAWDFANLMTSPHAPIAWAYNAANGTPENIGAFTPLSKTFRNIFTLAGVKDYLNSDMNMEAKMRDSLGLERFDKYDDYRIDRSLSNMATSGEYTFEEIGRAMTLSSALQNGNMTREDAMGDPAWDVYQAGVEMANQEFTGGPTAAILKFLGVPVLSYPEGEQKQRALQDDFARAYEKYHKVETALDTFMAQHPEMEDDEAIDAFLKKNPGMRRDQNAMTEFFDKHPEYEARLALFKKPEERMKNFAIDQLWSMWNQMPKITKDEIKDQMGDKFTQAFVDKNTRSYDAIDLKELQIWIKLMNGNPVGSLSTTERLLLDMNQLKLTKPETAWRVQVFYNTRNTDFENWYEVQNGYYDIPENKRRSYLNEHPELKQYWDWRRKFMYDNPDIVPYMTDDKKALEKAENQSRTEQAVPTANEILQNMSPAMQTIIQSGDLPYEAEHQLDLLADLYGLTEEEIRGIVGVQ